MNESYCVWWFLYMSPTNQSYCVWPSWGSHIVCDPLKRVLLCVTTLWMGHIVCDDSYIWVLRIRHIVCDPHKWVILCVTLINMVSRVTHKTFINIVCDPHEHCAWRRYEWIILCVTIPIYESYESVILCVTLMNEYIVRDPHKRVLLCVTTPWMSHIVCDHSYICIIRIMHIACDPHEGVTLCVTLIRESHCVWRRNVFACVTLDLTWSHESWARVWGGYD